MQHYRSVHAPSIWSDPSLGSFSDDRRFVYAYLLTHPELTSLGAICTTLAELADRFDWPFDRFQTAFNGKKKISDLPSQVPAALLTRNLTKNEL